jgi:hypothetical protein
VPVSNLGLGRSFASAGFGPYLEPPLDHSAASLAGGASSNGTSSPSISRSDRPAMLCKSPYRPPRLDDAVNLPFPLAQSLAAIPVARVQPQVCRHPATSRRIERTLFLASDLERNGVN